MNHVRVTGTDTVDLVATSGERLSLSRDELYEMLREGNAFAATSEREKHQPPPEPTPPMTPILEETVLAVAA